MAKNVYDEKFYDDQKDGSLMSAGEIVPVVMEFLNPSSVVDVGCGVGTFLSEFKKHGVQKVLGIDGDYVDRSSLMIEEAEFLAHDLENPLPVREKFDLAMSLEVAEHVSGDKAGTFVRSLASLSPVVLFSAAIPGQGGTSHINEQWQDYWTAKFEAEGYTVFDGIRSRIWNNEKICFWYRQNVALYVDRRYGKNCPALLEKSGQPGRMVNVVHPKHYMNMLYQYQKLQNPSYGVMASLKLLGGAIRRSMVSRFGGGGKDQSSVRS